MTRTVTNLGASARQKLLEMSRARVEVFETVATWYALERLLYRLGKSDHAATFVLKGAMLFRAWTGMVHRPTKDLDLLGFGEDSADRLRRLFKDICETEVEPDGMAYDAGRIRVEDIREGQAYQGKRLKVGCRLDRMEIMLQIDIGFGDVVSPDIQEIDYPVMLPLPAPRIRAYPMESVISEKLQALVALGMVNSRMKDFYDLWEMSRRFAFGGNALVGAIRVTFERRDTAIPEATPSGLSREFAGNIDKAKQWQGFLKTHDLRDDGKGLGGVLEDLRVFLAPPALAAAKGVVFEMSWPPGGPWERK